MNGTQKASAIEIIIPMSLLFAPQQIGTSDLAASSSLSVFLRRYPDRAYVTIVTRNGQSIPALDAQISRLLHSASHLYNAEHLPHADSIRKMLIRVVSVLVAIVPRDDTNTSEFRIVVILDDAALYIHADRMLSIPTASNQPFPIAVEVRGSPRPRPKVKNTHWVIQRHPLEKTRGPEFAETVLHNEGALYEGLISNFFVVTNNHTVITAPDSVVYPGTMRAFVIQACQRLDVPVILATPDSRNWATFRAAFITNAARMLVPVSSIVFQGHTNEFFRDIPQPLILKPDSPAMRLVDRLRKCVNELIELSLVETGSGLLA